MRLRTVYLSLRDDEAWEIMSFLKTIDHKDQWYGGRTYAQHGDDLAILNIMGCLRIPTPSYLDVGAHHPFVLSNTALLYERGCRGINVEANPALLDSFKRLRPEDKNVCVAVGPEAGAAILHRQTKTSGLNSLLPLPGLFDAIEVPVITIDEVVDVYANGQWPDLLSLDAEGMDLQILQSIDYARGGPKLICVEAISSHGDVSDALRSLLTANGYAVHSWAGSNMLFVYSHLIDWCR
jgi:FkbM family methyltransferase